jgi:hypothetical protein
MKLFWLLGCIWGALHYVDKLLVTDAAQSAAWWGYALDAMTLLAFAIAAVQAVRSRSPWFSLLGEP